MKKCKQGLRLEAEVRHKKHDLQDTVHKANRSWKSKYKNEIVVLQAEVAETRRILKDHEENCRECIDSE